MNKKGFTLIEVIVSIILVSIVMISLTSTIVELRNSYNKVKENSDVLIYSSVTSRVINNDIASNDGVRYIECNAAGSECGMVLGNNEKRSLKIYDSTNDNSAKVTKSGDKYILKEGSTTIRTIDVGQYDKTKTPNVSSCSVKTNCLRIYFDKNNNCSCIKETHETTLLYQDISNNSTSKLIGVTNPLKTIYIRTLSLERTTDPDTSRVTTEGYNYLTLDVDQYSYINKYANSDLTNPTVYNVLSKLTISIYNGLDTEDNTYDIVLYSSSRTDSAKARVGDKFNISLINTKGLTGEEINKVKQPTISVSGTNYPVSTIVEKYNNGFEFTDTNHNVTSISSINISTSEVQVSGSEKKTFLGYYTGHCSGTQVIDQYGNIIVNANYFDKNTEIYACWGKTVNTVKFLADPTNSDSTISSISSCGSFSRTSAKICSGNVTYASSYGALPTAPTRTGYKFLYWMTQETEEQIYDNSTVNYMIAHTIIPKWQANTINVSFNVNGGTCANCNSINVSYDGVYGSLPDTSSSYGLSRSDYTFGGWYTAASGGEAITSTSIVNVSGSSITLYAHWIPQNIKIKFDANGGSVSVSEMTVKYGKTYGFSQSLPVATLAGREFAGWYTSLNGGEKIFDDSIVVATETQTLYAHWLSDSYKVTFNANGGSLSQSETTVMYGEKYGTLPTPTKGLIAFKGWYTLDDCKGSKVSENTTVTATSNHTLYACYASTYTEYELLSNVDAYIIGCTLSTAGVENECYNSTTCASNSYCSAGKVKAGAKIYADKLSNKQSSTMINAYVKSSDLVASSYGEGVWCVQDSQTNSYCDFSKLYYQSQPKYFLHKGYIKVRINYVSSGASLFKDATLSEIRNRATASENEFE